MARRTRTDGSEGHGDVYRWLWRHRRLLMDVFASLRGRPCWRVIRDCMAEEGVLNELGRSPTSQALSETWARVNRNWAAREERRAKLAAGSSNWGRSGQ